MSSSRDEEKGESDEENRALLGARDEGREDDGEHLSRVDFIMELDIEKPSPTSSNSDEKLHTEHNQNSNTIVNAEEPNQVHQEPEKTNESEKSTDEVQKPKDQNFSLVKAIYNYNNGELKTWLGGFLIPRACPIPILRAACQASSNEEARQMLLDAGREDSTSDTTVQFGFTPLHAAAYTNQHTIIAKILGFPGKGLVTEETDVWTPSFHPTDMWFQMKRLPLGYTALHMASACAYSQVVRELLAAGASPNLGDESNSTPLDVAGALSSDDNVKSYVETLQLLRSYSGSLRTVECQVLERALRKRSLQALTLLLDAGAGPDAIKHRNPSGYTPMHVCVNLRLLEHYKVLLAYHSPKMNYRPVDLTDKEGSTVLHLAARERWSDGVAEALSAGADITIENSAGDTALHLATKIGDFDIVKQILDQDRRFGIRWEFLKENVEGESIFTYAILSGNADILKHMSLVNRDVCEYLSTTKVRDLAPLEYAAEKKFQNLFITILDLILMRKDEVIRIVYLIAKENLPELFFGLEKKIPIKYLKYIISQEYFLHEAIKHSSREMIIVLLREGADLSLRNEDGQTAINLLMYHVTKPTEFMTEILDGYINTDKNICDKDYVITINYTVLKPENKSKERDGTDNNQDDNDHLKTTASDMKVLEALIETGDVYDQRRLLTHPVVECFLYLKWKKCAKFIYFLISAFVLFLISFNTYIVTIYYHIDHKIKEQDILFIFNSIFWRMTALFTFLFFCLVDISFWSPSLTKWHRNKTIWLKLILIIGGLLMICVPMDAADTDIVRGVAVIAVSLSWIYLMILLSWTPTLGYYMQMYGKVSRNVIKVMLSFSFPLVGFSTCFMILLRFREPFDDPIAAFLKTMVMMSSEFDYENLVKNTTTDSPNDAKNSTLDSLKDEPLTSVFMLRIFFLLFLICVAIVLMNLMLGVAVSDFQELSHDGQQRRLMKQIESIIALERLFQRKPFSSFKFTETETWKVPSEVEVKSDSKIFGKEIKEMILNKAQSLKETKAKMADDVGMKTKIYDIYDLTKKQSDLEKELLEIRKSVNTISEAVVSIKDASEKRIDDAVDKILEAIANKRTDLCVEQKK